MAQCYNILRLKITTVTNNLSWNPAQGMPKMHVAVQRAAYIATDVEKII